MKKFVLPVAFLLTAFAASAQNKTVFGVRGALNVSSLTNYTNSSNTSNSTTTTTDPLLGFAAGVFAEAPIAAEFAIQPELDYSLKGGKSKGTDDKVKLGYLALPILFKYRPAVIKGANVFLGPELDYLISAKDKYTDAGVTYNDDVKKDVKSLDLGLDIGLGYDFLPNLGVDIRYGLGLFDISKNSGGSGSIKNRTIQFGLRYIFGK